MSKKVDEREGFTQDDWIKLCEFVESNVLGYDENMKPPRSLYLRLRGLSRGQFMANNHIKRQAEYSYEIILLTFKYSMLAINRALATKNFKSESNKINYIMVIIESNINDIYSRMKKLEESEERVKSLDMKDNYQPTNYYENKDKEESSVLDLLDEDIW